MSLAPLFAASFSVQLHAFAALLLIPLTLTIFALPRGSRLHKRLGWAWVVLMATVALSSFAVNSIRMIGPFSPIHLLSVLTLFALFGAIIAIRKRRVAQHRKIMLGLTYGALLGAGLFTLLPRRIMYDVVLSGLFTPAAGG